VAINVKPTVEPPAPKNAKSLSREPTGHADMEPHPPARPLKQIAKSLVETSWNVVTSALVNVESVAWVEFTKVAS